MNAPTQRAVASDLLDLDSLPGGSAASIELRETHISWVFLTDSHVYKIKKPVAFRFLDFRTIEARRLACEAELSLNARLAPDVYLDVVPVFRDEAGRFSLRGAGEAVDWAVRMVRLPDSQRGDVLLATRQLDAAHIRIVAERLAAFHAAAECDPRAARFGSGDLVGAAIEENFADGRAAIGVALEEEEEREIEDWQRATVRDQRDVFERRMKEKRVRDGHGDLRLEHLYFDDEDSLRILDCIEFNDRFRLADVCSDIAFLKMDLAWHGRVDLGERFLAEYARASNDYDLYSLVDFYESYRAYVRAKIETFLAINEAASDELRARAKYDARRYFLLALSSSRPPLARPRVVAVGGMIASGKSTISEAIAEDLAAPIVDADRTRKWMLEVTPTTPVRESAWSGAYDPRFTEKVYEEVLRRADVVLSSGRSVVVDASLRSPHMRAAVRALAEKHGAPVHFVECRAPIETMRARLRERAAHGGVSDGRLEILDDFCARFEAFHEISDEQRTVVDTTSQWEATRKLLRSDVGQWPEGLVS